jgi:FKBP-type peptidyl-prolyl cis-trans isomerase 2
MNRAITIALTLVLTLTSCSGSDDGDTTTSEATSETTTSAATADRSDSAGASGSSGAQDGDTVAVHYVGTLDDGSEFDSSYGDEPLTFEVGTDQVIEGFDNAVRGMLVGDKKTVRIPPDEAYGQVDEELIFQVPIEEAPEDVAVGDEVLIDGVVYGRVIEIGDTEVTIDTNHRFAGEALTFEIELVSLDG